MLWATGFSCNYHDYPVTFEIFLHHLTIIDVFVVCQVYVRLYKEKGYFTKKINYTLKSVFCIEKKNISNGTLMGFG